MLNVNTALTWLIAFASLFAVCGLLYSKKQSDTHNDSLDDFIVARNSQSSHATMLTMLATTLGTWVLFGPAESAVWGGIGAILGYALGSVAPNLFMVPIGVRIRKIMPKGHTLTEFVYYRYGRITHLFVLFIMSVYLFIGLSAGLTGIAQLVALLAPVPLWLTASIVMVSTLIYTLHGGLKASIFTDKVQMIIILPCTLLLFLLGYQATNGINPVVEGLQQRAPELLNPLNAEGFKTGVVFFLAVALTGLFYQGTWQRIFAASTDRVVRNGLVISGLLSFPIIFAMGWFGLAFVGLSLPGEGSVALFSIVLDNAPYWLIVGFLPFGLALIMSSADSTISGLNSLIIVELKRVNSALSNDTLLRVSRTIIIVISIIALYLAAQGLSILYLFLLADLLCCAAAFPIFFGFYNTRYQSYNAVISIIVGIGAGLTYFPLPGEEATHLFESFLLATLTPVGVSLLFYLVPVKSRFNFDSLSPTVKEFDHS
jgi:Na+/proline symporter